MWVAWTTGGKVCEEQENAEGRKWYPGPVDHSRAIVTRSMFLQERSSPMWISCCLKTSFCFAFFFGEDLKYGSNLNKFWGKELVFTNTRFSKRNSDTLGWTQRIYPINKITFSKHQWGYKNKPLRRGGFLEKPAEGILPQEPRHAAFCLSQQKSDPHGRSTCSHPLLWKFMLQHQAGFSPF